MKPELFDGQPSYPEAVRLQKNISKAFGQEPEKDAPRDIPVDIRIGENEITIIAPLPGVNPESIDIALDGQNLSISANMLTGPVKQTGNGEALHRVVALPFPVQDEAKAVYAKGVLSIRLKREIGLG